MNTIRSAFVLIFLLVGCNREVAHIDPIIQSERALYYMGTLVNEISEVDLMGITNIEELYVLTNPGDPELKDYSGISWKFRTRDIPNGFDYRLFPLRENSGDFGSVLISSPCSVHDEKGNEIRVVLTRELVVEKILESEFQRQIVQSGKRRQPRNGVSQKILNEETESGNIY